MDFDKIIRFFIIPFLVLLALKFYFTGNPNAPVYKGDYYQIDRPLGWAKSEKPADPGIFANTSNIKSVLFYNDQKVSELGLPPDSISVFETKLDNPMWVEDLFPDILQAIKSQGNIIIKEGDINIAENQVAKWVIYEDTRFPIKHLEFFFVDDKNGFYKIHCSGEKETFSQLTQICEQAKQSFKFLNKLF